MLQEQEVRSPRILHMAWITGGGLFLEVAFPRWAHVTGREDLESAFLAAGALSMGLVALSFKHIRQRLRRGINPSLPKRSSARRADLILHWATAGIPWMLDTALHPATGTRDHRLLAAAGLLVLTGRAQTEARIPDGMMPIG